MSLVSKNVYVNYLWLCGESIGLNGGSVTFQREQEIHKRRLIGQSLFLGQTQFQGWMQWRNYF